MVCVCQAWSVEERGGEAMLRGAASPRAPQTSVGSAVVVGAVPSSPATMYAEYTGFSWVRSDKNVSGHSEAVCETILKLRQFRAQESVAL